MSMEESIRQIIHDVIQEENEKHKEEILEILSSFSSSFSRQSEINEKPTLSVKEASAILGFGINKTYDLVQRSEYTHFPHLRDGAKIRIPHRALLNWIDQQAKSTKQAN